VGAGPGSIVGAAGSAATRSRPQPETLPQLRVSVVSAVLHPAATAFGRQRRRARLNVQIRARNNGSSSVTPGLPALLAAGVKVHGDPHAGPGLGSLAAGQTKVVTVHFEVAGVVTTQISTRRTARAVVAGHSLLLTVTPGPPV